MASSLDLLFRIQGDSTGAERALQRAAAEQRKYDLAIRKANQEMQADFAKRAQAEESAAREAEMAARRQADAYNRTGNALLGFGAVAGVALGLAGKAAIGWESDWASVTKTVNGANAEMEQSLRDLTGVLPATHHEIAEVASAAGALGIQTPNVVAFTKTMIDLGEATDDLDAQTAATQLAQFMNVVGTNQADVGRLAATLVDLGNNGASTEGQILGMAQRLAAAGRIARLSESDILGFASALTSVGIEAEAGGSAFSRVFISIDDAVKSGNENLTRFAEVAGMTSFEFARAFREDAAGAIVSFVEGLGRMDASGQSLTGTLDALELSDLRVRNALLSAAGAGDLMRESIDRGSEAWDAQSALLLEVAKRYETTESRLKIAKNQINDAAIDIGNNLLPVLASMADGVADAAKWFGNLPGPVQASLAGLGGIAATGALTVGAFLKIRASLVNLNETFKDAPGLAKATSLGLKALGGVAIAGGVVVGLQQITSALHDIFDPSFDTSKLRSDLIRLGATGKATGTLLSEGGAGLDDLRESFEKFEDRSFFDQDFLGFAGNSFVEQIEEIDSALSELVNGGDIAAAEQAIQALAESFADDWGVSAAEAVERITDSLPGYAEALRSAKVDAEGLTGAQGELAAGGDGVVGTLDDVKAGADGVFGSMDDLAGGMSDAAGEAEALTPIQQDLADAFGLTDEKARDAAESLEDWDEAFSGIVDKYLGTEEATDALQQAINDLASNIADAIESGEDWSFALDGTSDAALRNRDTMRDLIAENFAVIDSWDKTKLTSDELKRKIGDQKQAFIDQMVQLGYSRDAVEKYAGVFDQIPTDLPLDVQISVKDQEVKDAKAEAGFLAGALRALEEPAKLDVDDSEAREKGETWLNDAAHFFAGHTVGVGVDDEDARTEGERWLDDATYDYFVPHTVGVDANTISARVEGEHWLTDAHNRYFVPHTVHADADDSSARSTGLAWRDWADEIFRNRTVNVDVDVDIPWSDLQWLEDHLPGGTGGERGSGGSSGPLGVQQEDGGGGIGSQGFGQMSGFSVPAGDGFRGAGDGGGGGTTISKTAYVTVQYPMAERTSEILGREADRFAATL